VSRKQIVLVSSILGSGIVFLDGTVVNVALPSIRADLHGNLADQQWIHDGAKTVADALKEAGAEVVEFERISLAG